MADPDAAALELLREQFLEVMFEAPGTTLPEFWQQVVGRFPASALLRFLDEVERNVAASVYTRAEAVPSLREEAEEHLQEYRQEIARLRATLNADPPSAGPGDTPRAQTSDPPE